MFVRHVVLTVCALGLLAGSSAYAQVGDPGDPNMPSDPNEIAARCPERVTNIAEHAVARIEEVVAHGLDVIEVLMAAGEERAARAVARHVLVHQAERFGPAVLLGPPAVIRDPLDEAGGAVADAGHRHAYRTRHPQIPFRSGRRAFPDGAGRAGHKC